MPPSLLGSSGPWSPWLAYGSLGPSTTRGTFCTSGWQVARPTCKCGILTPACFGASGPIVFPLATTGPAPGANEDIPGNNGSRDALLFGTFRTVGVVWWERGVAMGLGLFGRDLCCFPPYHPFHLFHLCPQLVAYGTLFVPRLGLVTDLLGGLGVFPWTPFVGNSRRSTVVPR